MKSTSVPCEARDRVDSQEINCELYQEMRGISIKVYTRIEHDVDVISLT